MTTRDRDGKTGDGAMTQGGNLRFRIWIVCAFLAMGWGTALLASLWFHHRMDRAVQAACGTVPAKLESVSALERAFAAKDRTLNAILSGPPSEKAMEVVLESRRTFGEALTRVRTIALSAREHAILNDIESRVLRLDVQADQVLSLLDSGRRDLALERQSAYRNQAGEASRLFETLENVVKEGARSAGSRALNEASRARTLTVLGLVLAGLAAVALMVLVFSGLLNPLKKLARVALPPDAETTGGNDIEVLERRLRELMKDVDETHTELRLSREHLLQSGKLAMVGKLAAGVAHSIRNPLTSVKMRLFSMERALDLAPAEREDFEVISEEIRHIDTIVQNFLEFSRPPKLKIQPISASDVVDLAIQLLKHRVESYNVSVGLYRQKRLSNIDGDPEQLKEVLVNLIMNACEAMGNGGEITIREEEGTTEPLGRVVVLQVTDDGPGIPESIRERIFQPFFTTKEEGTGLGLSIAARIIEDHKGWLNCRSRPGKTTFTITLPCSEDRAWLRS